MFLKNIVIISVLVIISEAASIGQPKEDDITFQTIIRKEIPKRPDTKEEWEKNRNIESNKKIETNTPDLQCSEHTDVNVKQGIKSSTTTHQQDNELGHEKLSHSKGKNHIHTVGSREAHCDSPTKSHNSRTDLERDTETNAKDEERDQTLGNGKLHVDEIDANKKFHEHVAGDINSINHPDEDHVKASRIHYDDNDTSDTTHHIDVTRRTLKHGHGNLDITDTNNIVDKSDINTHNTQTEVISDTPEQKKKMKLKLDAVDTNDKTTTIEKINIIRETPISILNIVDENNEESNNNTETRQKQMEKSLSDKKGTEILIKENKYKEVTDNTLENTSKLTVNKKSKLRNAPPLSITFKTTSLDKQELTTNENNEKEVLTQTPTTETIEGYKEQSTSNYYFNALPDDEDGAKEGINNTPVAEYNDDDRREEQSQSQCETDEQAQGATSQGKAESTNEEEENNGDNGENNDGEKENPGETNEPQHDDEEDRKDNNLGTMVFLMPQTTDDNLAPQNFIDSAIQSDIIQNLLHFIKSNNLMSKIMIAGPINDSSPENLYNQIREHVKGSQTSLGIAEISIGADIIQIYKGEITEANISDTENPRAEVKEDIRPATTESYPNTETEAEAEPSKTAGDDEKASYPPPIEKV